VGDGIGRGPTFRFQRATDAAFLLFVEEQLDDVASSECVALVPHATPSSSPSGGCSMGMAGDVLYLRWPTLGSVI
jgi:hypothetical protein